MKSKDATFWKEAIDDEIESIMFSNTWSPLGIYLSICCFWLELSNIDCERSW
jgi:hypothetical protein